MAETNYYTLLSESSKEDFLQERSPVLEKGLVKAFQTRMRSM